MEYIPQLGSVMDTLAYSMLYFSYSIYEFRQKVIHEPDQEALYDTLLYFNQFRTAKRRIEPSEQFLPFFYYHGRYNEHFAVFKYFWEHISEASEDPNAFFDSMLSNDFYETCMHYYFDGVVSVSDLKEQKPAALLTAMAYLNRQGYCSDMFVSFLSDFEELTKQLIIYLKECFRRMESFRTKIITEIMPGLEETISESESAIIRMCSIPEDVPLEKQKYTIHIMDHLNLLSKRLSQSEYIVFVCASLSHALLLWGNSAYITLKSFGKDFGNDVSFDIIQHLRSGERTSAQLAKELFTSRSTTDRYIKALKDDQVIVVSRQIGTEVYYTLNTRYLLTLKSKIVRDVNDILEDIVKSSSSF